MSYLCIPAIGVYLFALRCLGVRRWLFAIYVFVVLFLHFFFFLFKKFCFYFIALWADLAFKRHVLVECGLSLTRCCGSCMLFTLKKVEILLIASAHATSLPAFKYKSMPLHSLTYWSYVKIYVHMYLNIYMYAIDCRLFICLLPFVGRRHFFTRFT